MEAGSLKDELLKLNNYSLEVLSTLLSFKQEAKMNENGAFNELVDRYKGSKEIFIADGGCESYNSIEHVVYFGNKYFVRVRDITSKQCMTQSLEPYLNEEKFDIEVSRILMKKQTKEVKSNPHLYRFLPTYSCFDYFNTVSIL